MDKSMIVRQLPKGVPAGYQPQRQEVRGDAYLVVSEYTRRIAHELDDLHSAWIIRHKADELAHLHESPFANGNMPLNHLDWLVEYEAAENRYQKVTERRLWLQNELGNMRRSRKVGGKFWHKDQFLSHYEALKLEMLYCENLQIRMRDMSHVARQSAMTNREKYNLLKKRLPNNQALVVLIELREALVEWLDTIGHPDSMTDRLRMALGQSRGLLQSEADEMIERMPEADKLVLLDSLLVRKSELTDARIKGNSINSATWITNESEDD